jgi:hypothetical protein
MKPHRTFILIATAFCLYIAFDNWYEEIKAEPSWFARNIWCGAGCVFEHHWTSLTLWTLLAGTILTLLWLRPETNEKFYNLITGPLYRPTILAVSSTVVTYQHARTTSLLSVIFSTTDKEIAEILAENPNADLTKHQEALGIEILDVQRKGATPPTPRLYV